MAKEIHGLDKILRNLNKEMTKITGGTMRGLVKSAIVIRQDMEKTSPKIPIDTGNLRASYFTNPHYIDRDPAVTLGFTAFYAWFVHENIGATFKRPGAGAKFLEESLKRNAGRVIEIIRREARIK